MSEAPVTLQIKDAIATIVLNRPDVGNAFDMAAAGALREAVEACAPDAAVRCVVLTGAGRMFCVGGDVSAMAAAGEERGPFLNDLVGAFHQAMTPLMRMNKPLVTLVNGPAAGAGFSLALAGDVVIAARSASFLAAYGAVGLTADGGMSWLLPRLVGLRAAQRIMLLGEKIGAEEAERLGMVTKVVDDRELIGEGNRVARQLKACSMQSLGGARALLRESFETGFEDQLDRERRSMVEAARSAENAEGVRAFLERRSPEFEKVS